MAILEKIAANILFFEKMSLTDKEKLKIAVEAHYKLHKSKGKSHTFTIFTKMVGSIELQSTGGCPVYLLCFVKVPK